MVRMLSPFSIEIDEVKPASEPSVAHSEELDEEEEDAVVPHVLELQAPVPVVPALGPAAYMKLQLSPSDFPLQAAWVGPLMNPTTEPQLPEPISPSVFCRH
jgi:hypothetical protein